jgi:hypothetical protein
MSEPPFVQRALHFLQPCPHGWTCTNCCWELKDPSILWTTGKKNALFRSLFAYKLSGSFRIDVFCENTLCCNPAHASIRPYYIGWTAEQHFFHWCEVCIHGYECRVCCWPWRGRTVRQSSHSSDLDLNIRLDTNKKISAREVMAQLFHVRRAHAKEKLIGCEQDPRCVQPAHVRYWYMGDRVKAWKPPPR